METLTLSTPILAVAGVTNFRLWVLDLRRTHPDRPAGILAVYREVDGAGAFIAGGKSYEYKYEGPMAETLIIALNKANLSTSSLEKRVTQQCQTDALLGAGTITGTP